MQQAPPFLGWGDLVGFETFNEVSQESIFVNNALGKEGGPLARECDCHISLLRCSAEHRRTAVEQYPCAQPWSLV